MLQWYFYDLVCRLLVLAYASWSNKEMCHACMQARRAVWQAEKKRLWTKMNNWFRVDENENWYVHWFMLLILYNMHFGLNFLQSSQSLNTRNMLIYSNVAIFKYTKLLKIEAFYRPINEMRWKEKKNSSHKWNSNSKSCSNQNVSSSESLLGLKNESSNLDLQLNMFRNILFFRINYLIYVLCSSLNKIG